MTPLPIRIYYEDTDFSGFVYHARYLHFFERGRTEALRAVGVDHRAMFNSPSGAAAFVVRRLSIEYHRPALMDDLLMVETRMTALGASSITMHQRLLRGSECLAEAEVGIAYVVDGRARRMPPELREKLGAILLANTKD